MTCHRFRLRRLDAAGLIMGGFRQLAATGRSDESADRSAHSKTLKLSEDSSDAIIFASPTECGVAFINTRELMADLRFLNSRTLTAFAKIQNPSSLGRCPQAAIREHLRR
ncbi:MAG TPA: hypothetical protein VN643_07505 [Pyrinomonadaceae bacterium]|nr:hypothetical protein [Pyrinomonadaceae bacterium]